MFVEAAALIGTTDINNHRRVAHTNSAGQEA